MQKHLAGVHLFQQTLLLKHNPTQAHNNHELNTVNKGTIVIFSNLINFCQVSAA